MALEDSFVVALDTRHEDECRRKGGFAREDYKNPTSARTRCMHSDLGCHSHHCHTPTRLPSRRGPGCVDKREWSLGRSHKGGGTKERKDDRTKIL